MQPMPDDRARALRIALAVLAGALGTALFAGGLWLGLQSKDAAPTQTEIEPAEPSEAPTGSAIASSGATGEPGSSETTAAAGDGAPGTSDTAGTSEFTRAAKVAFRLGASVYVANEDGSDAVAVARWGEGTYALSPDGQTLALIDGGALRLIDVATGSVSKGGRADSTFAPVWAPNSATVHIGRRAADPEDGRTLYAIARDGGDRESLGSGEGLAVSPDGRVLVVLEPTDSDAAGGFVRVSVDGRAPDRLPVSGGVPTAVGAGGDRIFVALSDGARGTAVISLKSDGSDMRQVAGAVPGQMPAFWSTLSTSPDGRTLALQADGDDGYRRSFITQISEESGSLADLTHRRDGSLHNWNAAGDRLFLIEGNVFQGQSTSLVSVARDGTGRRDIVTGAE